MFEQEGLSGTLQRRVVVVVEVVEAENTVATFLESEGAVRADEASGASDKDRHAIGAAWSGRVPDLFLPSGASVSTVAVESGGEEVVVLDMVVGIIGEWRVVEGEVEDESKRDEKSSSEKQLGGSV